MKQKIINFYQDGLDDWVAKLFCGHSQHMRHNPPWQNRQWIVNSLKRQQKIGYEVNCLLCDEVVNI